ncbi:MAG TPA: hypothetical protein VIG33_16720, partial [Pseudobdellovibrionaceae bacterium]
MKKQVMTLMCVITSVCSVVVQASTSLLPGTTVIVPGTTLGTEVDLAGGVVINKLVPFKIVTSSGKLLFRGNLQNRIVRSASDGNLHFYYAIRDTEAGLPGKILALTTESFRTTPVISTNYRVDGFGMVAPQTASRSYNGAQVMFRFSHRGPGMFDAGENSKFFVIKTEAKHYNEFGYTRITLRSGQSVLLKTAQPL